LFALDNTYMTVNLRANKSQEKFRFADCKKINYFKVRDL